jgi:uncharacterized protein YdaU (DUF1376 family)
MKVRRVDYSPDEFFAGVAGKMTPAEVGIYWMVCTLIYSKGGPIEYDPEWLARTFKKGTKVAHVKAIVDELIAGGKLELNGSYLGNKRASSELQRAVNRVASATENGRNGGRPSKQINGVEKPGGFSGEKLTINHQPSTTNLYSAPNGAGAEPPSDLFGMMLADIQPPGGDYRTALFRQGLDYLAQTLSKPPAKMRSALGQLLKAAQNDARAVWDALAAAQLAQAADPVPFAMKRFAAPAAEPPPNPERAAKVKAYLAAVDAAWRNSIGTTDPRYPKRADYGLEER